MLVILGVASLVICALLVVLGRAVFVKPTTSAAVRKLVNSATYHVFLATFAGMGVVMLLLFVIAPAGVNVVEIGLAAAIAVAGVVGVRLVYRSAGLAHHEAA